MGNYSLRRKQSLVQKIATIFVVLAIFSLIATGAVVRHIYTQNLQAVSQSEESRLITVAPGSTIKQIGLQLEEEGLIRKAWAFEAYVRSKNLRDKIQAGTYKLRFNQSVQEMVAELTRGNVATDSITILPGKRIDEVRAGLINAGYSAEDVDAALNPDLYRNHPALVDKPEGANLEGYLFPETFQKTTTTRPEEIIRKSLDQMHLSLTPQVREGIVRQGLTVHQGVILASIIEQEVNKGEDKPKVAQVFLKRLRENIRLESDPTAKYGAILDGQPPTLTYDSPYNTYRNGGLTPTPISNVGKLSLEAVANPANTDFLYFVAGDDGTTHYSRTLSEHEALTRQYCTRLCGGS